MHKLTAIIALGLLMLTGYAGLAGAQDLEIVEVDDHDSGTGEGYFQTIGEGEQAIFHWWLRNDEAADTIYVSIQVVDVVDDWAVELSNNALVLEPDEAAMVVLRLTPETWKDDGRLLVTVRFVFTDSDGGSHMEVRDAEALITTDDGEEEEEDDEMEEFLLFGSIPFDIGMMPGVEDSEFTRFVVQLLMWMVVAALVAWIINPITNKIAERTKTKVDDIIIQIIQWPVFLLVLIYGALQSLEQLSLPGRAQFQLEAVGNLFSFMIVLWMFYRLFKDVLIQFTLEYSKTTDTDVDEHVLVPLIEKLGMVLMIIISITYIMTIVGIDPSALMAGSVVIGMVLGFALQDTLSNFFAGIHLTLDQPFKTNDTIILENGDYCKIEKIGMRSVRMYNLFDHEHVIIPNNVLSTQKIVNASRPDKRFKVKVTVGVAYGADAHRIEKLLKKIASKHKELLGDEEHTPFVRMGFGDSSLDFTLIGWVDDFNDQWRVSYELKQMIYDRFDKESIEIPFPQRDLHLRTGFKDSLLK